MNNKENQKRTPTQEKGITLLALAITIIVLVILAAVTINGLTGEEGILTSTTTATNQYRLAEYEEMVQTVVAETIQQNALRGEDTYMTDISEALELEATWVQSIRNSTNTGISDSDTEIIVTTTDSYEVEVFYDNVLDKYYIAGTGKVGSTDVYPTVSASYADGTITIVASISNSGDGISKIEIISDSESETLYTNTSENTGTTVTYDSTTSGLYKIKVTTLNGITRYTWVRVTNTVDSYVVPTIAVKSGTSGENNWYKGTVTITITANNAGTTIYYALSGATNTTEIVETNKTSIDVEIEAEGLTRVIAWEEDSTGNASKYTYFSVKIDSTSPTIEANWSGTQKTLVTGSTTSWKEETVENDSSNWYVQDIEIEIDGTDESSGIDGYYYTVTNVNTGVKIYNNEYSSGSTRSITIATDGEYQITITAQDKAGNTTALTSFNIKKDTTGPETFTPTIIGETTTGFTMCASAMDTLSGIAYYDYYIDGECVANGTTAKTITVSGKTASTVYEVYVIAYDNAGNSKVGTVLTAQTNARAEMEANAPKLTDGMIPIKYDTEQGEWVICSTSDEEWYSYTEEDKQWANVMLSDGYYTTYTAYVGAVVEENQLGSMFVWIPRFAYKITSGYHSTSGTLDVVFLNGTTDEYYDAEGELKTASSGSDLLAVTEGGYGDYVVHPAFQDGSSTSYAYGEWDKEIEGIWVAKFQGSLPTIAQEDGYGDVVQTFTYTGTNQSTGETTDYTVYYPVFKGRKFAYNYMSVADYYYISMAMDDSDNPYGLTTYANAHLLKNSEWGAAAYLSISQYGYSGGTANSSTVKKKNNVSLVAYGSYTTSPITHTYINSGRGTTGTGYVTAISGYSATGWNTAQNYKSYSDSQTLEDYLAQGYTENLAWVNENLTDVYSGNLSSYVWNYTDDGSDSGAGTLSSTTGNIYGIYDMGGCLADYTTAYVYNSNLTSSYFTNLVYYGYSFFTGTSNKYSTVYPIDEGVTQVDWNSAYKSTFRMFGDAIYELSSNVGTGLAWFGQTLEDDDNGNEPFLPRGGTWISTTLTGLVRFL